MGGEMSNRTPRARQYQPFLVSGQGVPVCFRWVEEDSGISPPDRAFPLLNSLTSFPMSYTLHPLAAAFNDLL